MKGDSLKSVIVLTAICLVISLVLAITNNATAPVISAAEEEAAQAACFAVMPQATSFTQMELPAELPETVVAIYKENNSQGYVFKLVTSGYDVGLTLLCGIDADGRITGTTTLSSNETKTIGGKTQSNNYTDQYIGQDASLRTVSGISGATMTSNGYKNAIADAFIAFAACMQEGGNS